MRQALLKLLQQPDSGGDAAAAAATDGLVLPPGAADDAPGLSRSCWDAAARAALAHKLFALQLPQLLVCCRARARRVLALCLLQASAPSSARRQR